MAAVTGRCPWCGQPRRAIPNDQHEAELRLKLLREIQKSAEGKGFMGYRDAIRRTITEEEEVLKLCRK